MSDVRWCGGVRLRLNTLLASGFHRDALTWSYIPALTAILFTNIPFLAGIPLLNGDFATVFFGMWMDQWTKFSLRDCV